jgi:transposase
MECHPDRIHEGHLRTLQRRVQEWRALEGPGKDVIFEQEHPPGREGAIDFTRATKLGVTIRNESLAHLLFLFRLSYSGWVYVQVAFGETYEALVQGLQDALFRLGGVPEVIRHDNLSAATRELKRSGGRALTRRFRQVLDHYGARSTRIRPRESHENGIAEKGNDIVKQTLGQALVLRGSRDFGSVEAYQAFIEETVELRILQRVRKELEEERQHFRPLPSSRVPSYTTHELKVRTTSVIRLANRSYSVPSNLIGQRVRVRQHPDEVEVYFAERLVERMPRLRGEKDRRIDYRHVIWSLVRKPYAFARYRYREELFPTLRFREAWDRLLAWRGERACVEYVRILHLAASRLETEVDAALGELLEGKERFDYASVQKLCEPTEIEVPGISIPEPDLEAYDEYLGVSR